MKKIAVVILNWNGRELLEKFLPSVSKFTNTQIADIIIADNNSTDSSIKFVQENYPSIEIIKLDKNHGFAQGYNIALSNLNHKYFVLLNSDVEVSKNWIEPIIARFDEDSNIAAAQPKILAYNNKDYFEHAGAAGGYIDYLGFPFCRGRIFDTIEKDQKQYNQEADIFWASGAALFIRSSVYKNLGGLDSDFFAHMEEIDLCWRIKSQGYKIICCPSSTVYHVGGATLPYKNSKKLFLNFRNNLYMIFKNIDSNKFLSTLFLRMLLDGVAAIKFLFSMEFKNFAAVFNAHISFYMNLKKLIEKRKQTQALSKPEIKVISYQNSIVLDYFSRGKKKFSQL